MIHTLLLFLDLFPLEETSAARRFNCLHTACLHTSTPASIIVFCTRTGGTGASAAEGGEEEEDEADDDAVEGGGGGGSSVGGGGGTGFITWRHKKLSVRHPHPDALA